MSCNMCGKVIQIMTGHEINDLPEVTFAKRMALQPNLIFKYQIANEIINESNSENTLQFNGTSKWGEIFFTFDISSPERLFTGNISGLYINIFFNLSLWTTN